MTALEMAHLRMMNLSVREMDQADVGKTETYNCRCSIRGWLDMLFRVFQHTLGLGNK